jgi:hypothetical protein
MGRCNTTNFPDFFELRRDTQPEVRTSLSGVSGADLPPCKRSSLGAGPYADGAGVTRRRRTQEFIDKTRTKMRRRRLIDKW